MFIPSDPFDQKKQDQEIHDALTKTENTSVYLDTSSLVWMYRLSNGARSEFIELMSSPPLDGKVHIPIWATHELHRHRNSKETLFPAIPKAKSLLAEIKFLQEASSLFVDDKLAKSKAFLDLKDYNRFLEKSINDLSRALKIFDQTDIAKVEEELIPFFNRITLNTGLPNLSNISVEFSARCEGRVPPGFKDGKKKGSNEEIGGDGSNRYGDLVIWKEILTHASSNDDIKNVVIITHDSKPDWVFAPQRYIDHAGTIKNNHSKPKAVTTPHPTLRYEAQSVAGIKNLFILTIPQLIQIISILSTNKNTVRSLASAIQIEHALQLNDELNDETNPASNAMEPPSPTDGTSIRFTEANQNNPPRVEAITEKKDIDFSILKDIPRSALADAQYKIQPGNAGHVIQDLKSYNWYTQNPAVERLSDAIKDPKSSYEDLFVLGRNIYQAACGNSRSAIRLIENFENYLEDFDSDSSIAVLAGAVFEIYFDSAGRFRNHLKGDYFEPILKALRNEKYCQIKAWIREMLSEDREKLLYVPGDPIRKLIFSIEATEDKTLSISIDGNPITKEYDDGIWSHPLPRYPSPDEIKLSISEEFAIPSECVELQPKSEKMQDMSHLTFVNLAEVKFTKVIDH